MRKLILTSMLILGTLVALGLDEPNSKIIIYREKSYSGSALSFKIFINDSMVIKLRNNTYFEYPCYPGQYTVQVGDLENTKITIDLKENKTYYIKFGLRSGFWSSMPELLLIDNIYALQAVRLEAMKKLSGNNEVLKRPENRIGLMVALGFGLEDIPMVILEDGSKAYINFGGGIGIGLSYGHEVNRYFDMVFDFNYASISLTPHVENAEVTYSRLSTKITPSLIIPIDGGYSMRFKLGAGLGYYWNNRLNLETSELQNGFDDKWYYKNSLGIHARLIFELNPSEKWTLVYGISYCNVNYEYDRSDKLSYPIENRLLEANGSGINLILGVNFNFN